MVAYWVARAKVNDPAQYKKYADLAPAIIGKFGGKFLPAVPGLGFRFDTDERWPYPNPTGLAGVMEGYCPPHFREMRAAVEAVCERKFGPGGSVPSGHTGSLERVGENPIRRAGPQRDVQRMCGAAGAVRFRSLRQIPRHRALDVGDDLPAGASPRSGVLRRLLPTRRLPANPHRSHGAVAMDRGLRCAVELEVEARLERT